MYILQLYQVQSTIATRLIIFRCFVGAVSHGVIVKTGIAEVSTFVYNRVLNPVIFAMTPVEKENVFITFCYSLNKTGNRNLPLCLVKYLVMYLGTNQGLLSGLTF